MVLRISAPNAVIPVLNKQINEIDNEKDTSNIQNSTEILGVPRSYITFQAKKAKEYELTDDAEGLLSKAEEIARQYGHSEINSAHIIQAAILETETNYKRISAEMIDSGAIESVSTLNRIANNSSGCNFMQNSRTADYFFQVVQDLKAQNEEYLSSLPASSFGNKKIQVSPILDKELTDVYNNAGTINPFILIGASMNSMTNRNITYSSDFIKELISFGRFKSSDEIMKNYMPIYDKRAVELWNKLALGANVNVTYKDPKEAERLVSSLVYTINSPKYGNFNSENTDLYVLSDNVNDAGLYEETNRLAEDSDDEDVQTILVVDFDKILVNSVNENGDVNYSTGINQAIQRAGKNVQLILLQSEKIFFNCANEPLLKSMFKNFVSYSIPPIQTYEAQTLIKPETLEDLNPSFSKKGMERAIFHAANMDGIFPDKAIDLMKRISVYYSNTKEKITEKEVDEFAQIAHELFNNNEDNIVSYDTGKTLSSIYGKETIKKEIETIVSQIKTGRIGTRGMIIYSQDPEAGSGRQYTAETIAGEAKVPFVSINTSDFASYDRDSEGSIVDTPKNLMSRIFLETKKAARQNQYKTAILYIGNFEDFAFSGPYLPGYKQAMTQLAHEMQKAEDEDVNILVIGSTDEYYANAIPEVVRGFNNILTVDSPARNKKARREIITNRLKETNLQLEYKNSAEKTYIINKLVKLTEWMSFVEIKSLIDKSKQIMFERNKTKASVSEFIEAYLQMVAGRTSHPEMPVFNKEATTSHECGHATNLEVMNDLLKRRGQPWHKSNNVNFITLDPRGDFLGAVFEGKEDNTDYPFEALFTALVCSYGGYSCEKKFFNMDGSAGITQDLAQATSAAKSAVEFYGLGHYTGKISNAVGLKSAEFYENVYKDIKVLLENAQAASDLITDCYKGFNEWFTREYSKLIGTNDCMVDGDEFRKSLANWKKKLPKSQKEEIAIMDDIIMDIIECTKKGKIYGKVKKVL